MKIRYLFVAFVGLAIVDTTTRVSAQTPASWLQWGGPTRNFMSDSKGLASSWPAGGPKKLWSRALGEGHSSIVAEGGRLFTMYRLITRQPKTSHEEVVAALDAATGKTIWEFKYAAPPDRIQFDQGYGPHSTPLISGNLLFAASSRSELFALDKATGKRVWSHDLVKEYGAPLTARGYSCSPILYKGTVIVTMGGLNQGVAAFDQQSGKLVWKGGTFIWAPASPILIDVDGQPQLVVFGGDIIIGMDPANGKQLWSHPHRTDWGLNISTPVWSGDTHLLFASSAYGTGSRALELRQTAGKTTVTEKRASQRCACTSAR
jgi:outer membrane protein assembly factor BamB